MTPAELTPPAVVSSMVRLRGEGKVAHRAFLLWAMGGEARSLRAVHRALRKSDTTIRQWSRRMEWERRYLETADPDVEAYLVYQRDYLAQCGCNAIVRMMANIVPIAGLLSQIDAEALRLDEQLARERAARLGRPDRRKPGEEGADQDPDEDDEDDDEGEEKVLAPFIPEAPRIAHHRGSTPSFDAKPPPRRGGPQRKANPELNQRMAAALGLAVGEGGSGALMGEVVQPGSAQVPAVAPTQAAPPAPTGLTPEQVAATIRRDLQLIDASLGYFAQKLKAGEIPVRMADLPILLKVKQLLLGRATSNVAVAVANVNDTTQLAPVPTVRVQQAKGEDAKMEAYREDVADLMTILDGLAAGKVRDAEVAAVTTGDQRERA